jgi:hypothetical protein
VRSDHPSNADSACSRTRASSSLQHDLSASALENRIEEAPHEEQLRFERLVEQQGAVECQVAQRLARPWAGGGKVEEVGDIIQKVGVADCACAVE